MCYKILPINKGLNGVGIYDLLLNDINACYGCLKGCFEFEFLNQLGIVNFC